MTFDGTVTAIDSYISNIVRALQSLDKIFI